MRILFLLFLSFGAWAQQTIQVTDLLKIQTVGKPAFSPDGNLVLFSVTSIEDDAEKKGDYIYQTQLHVANFNTKINRALTAGKHSISAPSWSPDGLNILFSRDLGMKSQAYILSLSGGEPMALTNVASGIQNPVWAKSGESIFFQTSISLKDFYTDSTLNKSKSLPTWSLEKPGISNADYVPAAKANPNGTLDEIRAYLAKNEKDNKAKVINRLQFQEETATSGEIKLSTLFSQSIVPGSKPVQINNPLHRWSDWEQLNANELLVILPADSLMHPDKVQESQVVSYDMRNKSYKSILIKAGYRYSTISLSTRGDQIAFFESKVNGVSNPVLKVLNINSGLIQTVNLDRVVTQLKWSSDDSKLYLTAQDRGAVPLMTYTFNTQRFDTITSMEEGILGFDVNAKGIAYAKTGISNPSELFFKTAEKEEQVTSLNAGWLASKTLAKVEKHVFTNTKGQVVDYWVMKPIRYIAGQKYPLIVEIHGGPTAMWGPGEASMWHEFQYYAAQGMGIVYCNPRGSGGYGTSFMASNVKDWGAGPMADVMQATDLAIKEGWADTTRLAVTGGSYAGYLVAWIVGHTNRFKVAAAQRGVYELSTFYGEGNAWRLVPNYFGGYPWEKPTKAILDHESPLTYVASIKTPLIIFHGENDLRTGVIQSEMLYKSLKQLGREVEYVRHPGASHEITRSGNNRQRIDQMLRTYEFFARKLK
jgi:dipeptidyl aminopeptidase/acylaminoacyl peptidase